MSEELCSKQKFQGDNLLFCLFRCVRATYILWPQPLFAIQRPQCLVKYFSSVLLSSSIFFPFITYKYFWSYTQLTQLTQRIILSQRSGLPALIAFVLLNIHCPNPVPCDYNLSIAEGPHCLPENSQERAWEQGETEDITTF